MTFYRTEVEKMTKKKVSREVVAAIAAELVLGCNSQTILADEVGISLGSINAWFRGRKEMPQDAAKRIVEHLGGQFNEGNPVFPPHRLTRMSTDEYLRARKRID